MKAVDEEPRPGWCRVGASKLRSETATVHVAYKKAEAGAAEGASPVAGSEVGKVPAKVNREAPQQHDTKHVCSAWGWHLRCVLCNQRARSYHPESCVLLAIHCMDGRKVSVRAPLRTKVHELKEVAGRSIDVAPGLIGMFVAEREEALPDDAALGSLGIDFASSDTSKTMLFLLFRPGWLCSR